MDNDIIIKNGFVMEGTGRAVFEADILIHNNRIKDIGNFGKEEADRLIEAKGLVVAPGFIDVHSHLDFLVPSARHVHVLETWIRQGVTTIVGGNCGYSPAPINHDFEDNINTYWNFALPYDGLKYEWTSMVEFFNFLDNQGLTLNVAILTGHNTLRTNVMGFEARLANNDEIEDMKKMLTESLEAGSIGLSLGLDYVPGIYSNTEELLDLTSIMTKYRVPLVPHTRSLLGKLYVRSVEEVIYIAEKNNIPLHISHHFGGGIGRARKLAIKAIDAAINRGVVIGHDNIPEAVSSSTVLMLFPPWLFDGGVDKALERLQNTNIRNLVIEEIKTFAPKWPPWENKWWTSKLFNNLIVLFGFRKDKNKIFECMRLNDIAQNLNKEPIETLIDLTIEENGRIFYLSGQFDNEMADDFVYGLFSDPNCSLGTDIVGADFKTISPVAYGAFTKILGEFSRDKGIMTQEEAVRRITSLPAKQMQIKDRGIIEAGAYADITIFNPKTVKNNASYTNPYQPSEGIEYVIINGQLVLEKDKFYSKKLAGKVLRSSL
ncbi:MAG: amidohydrolase family protein [Promethearchaeota archaeon]